MKSWHSLARGLRNGTQQPKEGNEEEGKLMFQGMLE